MNFMSQPRTLQSYPQPGRDTKKDVVTPTPSSLSRDAKTMSEPRPVWPRSLARCPGRGRALALSWALLRSRPPLPCAPSVLLVTTSKLGRDLVLEIGSSHSSFYLAQKIFFFFFQSPPVAFPATPKDAVA